MYLTCSPSDQKWQISHFRDRAGCHAYIAHFLYKSTKFVGPICMPSDCLCFLILFATIIVHSTSSELFWSFFVNLCVCSSIHLLNFHITCINFYSRTTKFYQNKEVGKMHNVNYFPRENLTLRTKFYQNEEVG